jgi:CDP-6-deoxy-D-xylo-4-hexulose-3-dehydrase
MTNLSWPLMVNNIEREDLDLLIEYLRQDDPKLTHGPKVMEFEEDWSNWLGVKYSVMLNSGSSANDLTMLALREMTGLGEVIVPALTWVSDIASVLHAGFTPVFVDINPDSLALDTELVLQAVTPKTKAVFLTHILGYNGLTDKLFYELQSRGIRLIEDVCESHGATHNGKKLGSFGWASNFSFYYAHHMTTIEGGMISTNDEDLYDLIRMLRSHGLVRESMRNQTKKKFQFDHPDLNPDFIFAHYSHNMRPNELNGILGLAQLKRLDRNVQKRSKNLDIFLSGLDPEVFKTDFAKNGNSNYAFTLVLTEKSFKLRNSIEEILKSNNIEFRRGLSGGGNQLRQPYLRKSEFAPAPESLPNTDHVHHFGWYIGNYPDLEESKIKKLHTLLCLV